MTSMTRKTASRVEDELSSPRTRERLVRVVGRVLGDTGEWEDAVHDAVIQALRAAGGFRDEAQVTTWLHRVAVNAALMQLRKKTRAAKRVRTTETGEVADLSTATPEGGPPHPGALLEEKQEAARVRAAVESLPALYRDVLRLVVFEEAPLGEAARVLGLTPSAVRTRMGRARAQLRQRLAA